MNNSVFGKAVDSLRKQYDIRFVNKDKRRRYLVSEPNYHTTEWFSENLLANEKNRIKIKI